MILWCDVRFPQQGLDIPRPVTAGMADKAEQNDILKESKNKRSQYFSLSPYPDNWFYLLSAIIEKSPISLSLWRDWINI